MLKLSIEAIVSAKEIADGPLAAIAQFNFLYYSGLLLVISVAIIILLSLMTTAPSEEKTKGITWSGLSPEDREAIRSSWDKWDIAGTVVVMSLVLGMYLYFSYWLG